MGERFDDAVVGAGILGLAHAFHLARRGRRVLVLERDSRARGASVRNFGMLWPIGQPAGERRDLALRSRALWLEVLRDAGVWHDPCGSLHLAYRDDEERVLREFAAREGDAATLLAPADVVVRAPAVRPDGLRAGLFSPTEICVDPREVVAALPGWLARRYGVHFEFGAALMRFEDGAVVAGGRRWSAGRLILCPGADASGPFAAEIAGLGLAPCKLQMLRSAPLAGGWRIGPMLAGGLTLRHYASFAGCPGLAALRARVASETPDFDRFGIHVMVSQNGRGEVVIGDSHEYGAAIEPFDKPEIDSLVLGYLGGFLRAPGLRIAARWHGVYAKHPSQAWAVAHPTSDVAIVTGVGGAGMTLSFGLAERIVKECLGEG